MNPIDSQSLDALDKYINDSLSKAERAKFENRLSNEPDLKHWLDWLQETSEGMEGIVIKENKDVVKEWLKEDKAIVNSPQYKLKPFVFILLFLSLAITIAFYLLDKKEISKPSTIQLVDNHLNTPYKNPTVLRNVNSDPWQKSIDLYAREDFKTFIEANSNLVKNNDANNEQIFYLALANLYQMPSDHNLAIDLLNKLIVSKNGYEDLALWFRGLAYIKANDFKKAKSDLILLIERGNYKVNEAKELLASFE